jgi:hypothetical protein
MSKMFRFGSLKKALGFSSKKDKQPAGGESQPGTPGAGETDFSFCPTPTPGVPAKSDWDCSSPAGNADMFGRPLLPHYRATASGVHRCAGCWLAAGWLLAAGCWLCGDAGMLP